MGDRAVIGFRESKNAGTPIWLYTHWSGSLRYKLIADALEKASSRWNDAPYATRIAISTIVGESWSSELGYGISAGDDSFTMPDYSDIPVVCWKDREVVILGTSVNFAEPIASMSFDDAMKVQERVPIGLRWG